MSDNLQFETLQLHVRQEIDAAIKYRTVLIYQTSLNSPEHAANLFGLKEFGNIYSPIMNPKTDVFEKRMTPLEGGVAVVAPLQDRQLNPLRSPTLPDSTSRFIRNIS